MTIIILSIIVFLFLALFMVYAPKYLKLKKCQDYEIYKDIVFNVINTDGKTRKNIEKQCKEYLEHKVINPKFTNDRHLKQCQIMLDSIMFTNAIVSVEPIEEKVKEPSKIEKAIEDNKKAEKVGKYKKGG